MAGSYSALYMHFVFSTKKREPWLQGDMADHVHRYIATCFNDEFGHAIRVNGMNDHVHILADMKRDVAPADCMRKIKALSSKWLHKELDPLFNWQRGYGVFSVSQSATERVKEYISNQVEHHQSMTFEQEYFALLKKHGIEFDPQYVLD